MKEMVRSEQDTKWIEQKLENRRKNEILRHNVWNGGMFYRQLISARRMFRNIFNGNGTENNQRIRGSN